MADIDWCDGFLVLMQGGAKVEGEALDAGFVSAIEIISFEFGSSQPFDDDQEFADQAFSDRAGRAKGRMMDDEPAIGMQQLFGDPDYDYAQDITLSDADFKKYQGDDLGEVDACQFEITKQLDRSSPALFRAYCSTHSLTTREVFDTATVTLRKASGDARVAYLVLTFNDVVTVGYTLSVDSSAFPRETVTFSFAKCKMEYKPQNDDGTLGAAIRTGWNFLDREAM